MKKYRIIVIFLIGPSLLYADRSKLQTLLPSPHQIEGWKTAFEPEIYSGEDLYLYINGGAEMYHEYGFQRVIVQDYRSPQTDNSVSLEIYEMNDSLSAYGIFSFKTSPGSKSLAIGWQCRLDDYYLNCWKGPYIITVTGFNREPETLQALQAVAGRAAENIDVDAKAMKPDILAAIPEAQLIPGSIVYMKGRIAFSNHFPVVMERPLDFNEAVKAGYLPGYSLYILKYSIPAESKNTLQSVTGYLMEEFGDAASQPNSREALLVSKKNKTILFKQQDAFLYIVTGASDYSRALQILEDISPAK
jgi:hypothetical protein